MFYTLMQRYMMQQLEQLQALQRQQSQFLAWQVSQYQAWQAVMLKTLLNSQRLWLPSATVSAGFAPFTWPFMQYQLNTSVTTNNTDLPQRASIHAKTPLRDVTPTKPTNQTHTTELTAPATKKPTAKKSATEKSLPKKSATPQPTAQPAAADITPTENKIVIPDILTHQIPEPRDNIPPQVDFPQPTVTATATLSTSVADISQSDTTQTDTTQTNTAQTDSLPTATPQTASVQDVTPIATSNASSVITEVLVKKPARKPRVSAKKTAPNATDPSSDAVTKK